MSTYTKYHTRIKENISRLRNPGNENDGLCEDRVIFANGENIYNGKFIGELNLSNAILNNVEINDSEINGATLNDVTIKMGSQIFSIADLTSDVSQISTNFSILQENFNALNGNFSTLSTSISTTYATYDFLSQLSTVITGNISSSSSALISVLSDISSMLSNQLLSTLLSTCDTISSYADAISSNVDEMHSNLSNLQQSCIIAINGTDKNTNSISTLSNSIISKAEYLGECDIEENPISITLSQFFQQICSADVLHKGAFAKSINAYSNVADASDVKVDIGKNDFLFVNKDKYVSALTWNDIDFMKYSLNEINAISSTLSNAILSLDNIALSIDPIFEQIHDISSTLSDALHGDNVNLGYSNLILSLSAGNNVTSVDCKDFVLDNALSNVELCGTTLVFSFNDNSYHEPISIQLSSIIGKDYDNEIAIIQQNISNLLSDVLDISNEVSSKIAIDDQFASQLCIRHVSQEDFYQNVVNDALCSNTFYIVSSDYVNAYNEQIRNVAEPTLSDDAATKAYVDYQLSSSLENYITLNDLSIKQDKLLNTQILAIDSIVDEQSTIVTYNDGTISSFNIVDTITSSDIPNIANATDIKIGMAIKIIDYAFYHNIDEEYQLSNVILPNSIIEIGNAAFQNCKKLTHINIPNNVKYIGNFAFHNCAFSSIELPDNITLSIGTRAFYRCNNLTSIIIPNNIILEGTDIFLGCNNLQQVIFENHALSEISTLTNYPWGLSNNIIKTWNTASQEWIAENYVSKQQIKDTLSSISNISNLNMNSDTSDIISSVMSIRDMLSALYLTLG